MRLPAFLAVITLITCAVFSMASASWSVVGGLAVGKDGSVYAIGYRNSKYVQKFDASGNLIAKWTIEGAEKNGPCWVSAIMVDSDGNVCVLDSWSNGRMLKYDTNGKRIGGWKLGGNGWGAKSIAADSKGNLYVLTDHDGVQVYNGKGILTGVWGLTIGDSGEFVYPSVLALDEAGSVYVAESNGSYTSQTDDKTTEVKVPARFQKLDSCGKGVTWGGGDGHLADPCGMALDRSGNVYVVDDKKHSIQEFDSQGRFVKEWSGISEEGDVLLPQSVAIDSSGNIYVGESGSLIKKYDPSMKLIGQWFVQDEDHDFPGQLSIAVNSSGDTYLSDSNAGILLKYDPSGVCTNRWTGTVQSPQEVAVGKDGRIYIADSREQIQVLSSEGKRLSIWNKTQDEGSECFGQTSLNLDSNGNVYLRTCMSDKLKKFNSSGKKVVEIPLHSKVVSQPKNKSKKEEFTMDDADAICLLSAVDGKSNIYVAHQAKYYIQKLDYAGKPVLRWGRHGKANGQFEQIGAITTDGYGFVYVTSSGDKAIDDRVQKFDSSGKFVTAWKPKYAPADKGSLIGSIAVDGKGNLYLVIGKTLSDARIQEFDSKSGEFVKEWKVWQPKSSK